jgi:hypothetical protein
MSKHALAVPLPECWTQEALGFPLSTGPDGSFQISLTGCKAGDLKGLRVYVVDALDVADPTNRNPNLLVGPSQVTFAINGLIYMDSTNGSWLLTNLLRRRQPPVLTYSALQAPAVSGNPFGAEPSASQWVEINLAQPHTRGDSQEVALVHGVPVMNSVLNLTGVMPNPGANYVCHIEYVLNCSWMASRGSADFVF